MKIATVLQFVLILSSTCTSAQVPYDDLIFGIHNPQPGIYHFSRINRTTGTVSDLQQLPITNYGGLASLTVDPDLQRLVFNSASAIHLLDPAGIAPMTTIIPPLPQGAFLGCLQRDACSGAYYGFLLLSDGSRWFVAYDLTSNALTTLSQIEGLNGFSEMSYINAAQGIYVIEHAHQLMVIDLDDGAVLSNQPIVAPEGHSFRGIALHCASRRTFGTIASAIADPQKWLGELDVATGEVSFLSETSTSAGFLKPSSAGACIVQDEGLYLWEGTGGLYVGSTVIDGAFAPVVQASSTATVHDIVHYSTCDCPDVATSNLVAQPVHSAPFPNPTTGTIQLNKVDSNGRAGRVRWVDPLGRALELAPQMDTIDMSRWDLSGHPKGIYVLFWSDGNTQQTWRIAHH